MNKPENAYVDPKAFPCPRCGTPITEQTSVLIEQEFYCRPCEPIIRDRLRRIREWKR
jgi:hypothetical protein